MPRKVVGNSEQEGVSKAKVSKAKHEGNWNFQRDGRVQAKPFHKRGMDFFSGTTHCKFVRINREVTFISYMYIYCSSLKLRNKALHHLKRNVGFW